MKLNKKGFAISTMLYGVVFVAIAVFYMIIAYVSNRNINNTNFTDEIRNQLNGINVKG